MMPEIPTFFVRGEDGEEYGPVHLSELREWVHENRAGIGTEVRRDEPDAPWRTFQDFPELIALAAEATASDFPPGLVLAPLGRRMMAFGADLVLSACLFIPVCLTLIVALAPEWFIQCWIASQHLPVIAPDAPRELVTVVEAVREFMFALYFAGFVAAHGRTPAKQALRLRVVDQQGRKPDLVKSMVRALVLLVSTGVFFIPLIYAFFNPQRRGLHDLVAGTYVVEA